jgi:hypothetical protein
MLILALLVEAIILDQEAVDADVIMKLLSSKMIQLFHR